MGRLAQIIDALAGRHPEHWDEPQRARNGQYLPSLKERRRRAAEASVRMQLELARIVTPPEQFAEAVSRASTRPKAAIRREG
jgi:hypothetical protein